jgi:hypothetical protein
MEGIEWTKAKYTNSGDTLRNPLNINSDINNEIQVCKIGTMYVWEVLVGGEEVN